MINSSHNKQTNKQTATDASGTGRSNPPTPPPRPAPAEDSSASPGNWDIKVDNDASFHSLPPRPKTRHVQERLTWLPSICKHYSPAVDRRLNLTSVIEKQPTVRTRSRARADLFILLSHESHKCFRVEQFPVWDCSQQLRQRFLERDVAVLTNSFFIYLFWFFYFWLTLDPILVYC